MEAFIYLSIGALICGFLYGLGTAVLILYLNAPTVQSLRSGIMLTMYLSLFYALMGYVPLTIAGIIFHILISTGLLTVVEFMVGFTLFAAMINIFIHVRFYRSISFPTAQRLITMYGIVMLLACIIAFVTGLRGVMEWRLLAGTVGMLGIISAMMMTIFVRGDYGYPENGISIEDAQRLMDYRRKEHKVIWFGIDSATWDIMESMIDEGTLPNLAALRDAGCYGRLKTVTPTYSPVLWTSKATGKTPLQHGVRNFIVFAINGITEEITVMGLDPLLNKVVAKAATYGVVKRRPVDSRDRKSLALWNILSEVGHTIGVLSWFLTDPIEKINGAMVPEFYYLLRSDNGSSSEVYPPYLQEDVNKIKREIQERFAGLEGIEEVKKRFNINGELTTQNEKKLDVLTAFYFQDVLRVKITDYFLSQCNFDMIMLYFHGVDAVQHRFWGDYGKDGSIFKDTIGQYYQFIDEILGNLLQKIPEHKTVIITSDHGHEPVSRHRNFLNTVLRRENVSGTHSQAPDGIFIASGDGIKKGIHVKDMFIYDVVPTILPLWGLPVGRDMAGRPMVDIYDKTVSSVTYIDTYEGLLYVDLASGESRTEDREILKRLRDLGYID